MCKRNPQEREQHDKLPLNLHVFVFRALGLGFRA